MKLSYRTGIPAVVPAMLWACGGGGGGGTTQNPTLTVSKVSGDSQVADAGSALASPLVVIVKDDKGSAVSGQTITWSVTGGGSVTPGGATGADGQASATRTLGPNAGIQTTTAKLGSSTVGFTNIAHIQGATQIALNGGNGNQDTVLATLAPLTVVVRDENNAPVANVTVTWAVTGGGGHLSGATSQTNGSGIAQITDTLGSTAGAQTVTAAVTGLAGSPVTFTNTATAGNATSIALFSGNFQVGPVSTALPSGHVVIVRDAHANPVAGVTVHWGVVAGAGSVSSNSVLTLASGLASITKTLGAAAGVNQDTAGVSGLAGSPVTFTDTAATVSNVQIKDDFFTPDSLIVTAGSFVKYTWTGAISHNVTWDNADNPTAVTGSSTQNTGTYTTRLTLTGKYVYFCSIHGTATSGMRATVTVNP